MRHTIELSTFIERMATLGGDVEAAVVRGLQTSAQKLHGMVVEEIDKADPHPAVDRGELRNSVDVRFTPKGAYVEVNAAHARFIEDGTRPFFPPLRVIMEWLIRKKLASPAEARARAWAICKAISERGIAPRHYMAKAFARFNKGRYVGRFVGRELELLARARGKGRVNRKSRRGSGLKGG